MLMLIRGEAPGATESERALQCTWRAFIAAWSAYVAGNKPTPGETVEEIKARASALRQLAILHTTASNTDA